MALKLSGKRYGIVVLVALLVLALPETADAKKPPVDSVKGVTSFGAQFEFNTQDKDCDPPTTHRV